VSSIYYLARSGNTLARWTPRGARHALGSAVGAASYLGWASKRWVTQLNMAQVTGRSPDDPYVRRLAFASWRNYGRYAADFIHFPHFDLNIIEQNARDLSQGGEGWKRQMQPALQEGRGIIVATAHFGNWDMAGAILARHFSISAVAETFSDERLNRLLQDQRKEKGIGIIPMEGSARRILRVLQQNQLVAIVVDRPLSPDQGTAVTFFGRKTYVPSGPAALAIKSGAAIVPGFAWYGDHNQFYTRVFPPIFPQESRGEQRANEMVRLTQCIYDALEEMVREWPTQWYMFRQFWPSE
jgi:lauroyl/myristoyl acyltransferase